MLFPLRTAHAFNSALLEPVFSSCESDTELQALAEGFSEVAGSDEHDPMCAGIRVLEYPDKYSCPVRGRRQKGRRIPGDEETRPMPTVIVFDCYDAKISPSHEC